MTSLKNTLQYLNDNWSSIIIIIGLLLALYVKVTAYIKKSREEKIALAKKALSETILKKISDAEIDWFDYKKSGNIKRSQVLECIYKDYPILKNVINQDELIKWIDSLIDDGLKTISNVITEDSLHSISN